MRIQQYLATAFLAMSLLASATAFAETGIVALAHEAKGYGYIKIDGTGREVFFEYTGLIDQVFEKSRVQFDIVTEKKGSKTSQFAKNIRLIPPN